MIEGNAIRTEALELLTLFRAENAPSGFWEGRLPADTEGQFAMAQAMEGIGQDAYNADENVRAQDAFLALFLLRTKRVERQPSDRGAIRDFATAQDFLGSALLRAGNLDAGEQMLRESLRYRRGLFQDEPSHAHSAHLYGISLWHMALLERARGDASCERDWIVQALEHMTMVDATWPGVSFIVAAMTEIEARAAEFG